MLIVAAVVRILYFFQVSTDLFSSHLIIDAQFYDSWAQRIIGGDWLGRDAFYQDPLYAYFLAGCYWIIGHHLSGVRLVQIALDVGTVGLIYCIGRMLYNARAGLAAAAAGALYGPLVFFSCLLDKTTVTTFLIALSLTLLIYASKRPSRIFLFVGGLAFGTATLTRGNMLVVGAAMALWLAFSNSDAGAFPRLAYRPLIFLFGLSTIVGLVTVRNYRNSRDFVLLTSNAGLNFFIGNNPFTPGNYLEPPFIHGIPEEEFADSKVAAEQALGKRLDKASEVSSYWFGQGMAFIRSSPTQWLALEVRKFYLLLNSFEIPETYSFYYFRDKYWALWVAPLFLGILLPLGIAGGLHSLGSLRQNPLPVFLIAYGLSICLFFVTSRYRFPIVLPLLVFAGFFMVETLKRWDQIPFNIKARGLAALVGLAAFCNWRPSWMIERVVVPGLSTPHSIAGLMLNSLGKIDASIEELELARSINPSDPRICAVLADSYSARGQADKALGLLLQAVETNPRFHEAFNNLGKLYFDHKNYPMALKAFQAALSIRPDEPTYRQNYEHVRRLLAHP